MKSFYSKLILYFYIISKLKEYARFSITNFNNIVSIIDKDSIDVKEQIIKEIKKIELKSKNKYNFVCFFGLLLFVYNIILITFLHRTFFRNYFEVDILIFLLSIGILIYLLIMHKFDKFETPVLIVLLFFYLVNFLILIYNNIHLEDTSLYNTANIIIIRTFNSSETYEMVLPNLISIPTFLVSIYFIFLYIYGLKNKVEVINKGNYNTYTVTLVIASALLMSSIIYTIGYIYSGENFYYSFLFIMLFADAIYLIYSIINYKKRNIIDFIIIILLPFALLLMGHLGSRALKFYHYQDYHMEVKYYLPFYFKTYEYDGSILLAEHTILNTYLLMTPVLFCLVLWLFIRKQKKIKENIKMA